jgi:hypothetical protein
MKQLVQLWDWKDTKWQYSPDVKLKWRRLRRKREKERIKKIIQGEGICINILK